MPLVAEASSTEVDAQFPREVLGEVISRLQALHVQLEPPEVYELTVQR